MPETQYAVPLGEAVAPHPMPEGGAGAFWFRGTGVTACAAGRLLHVVVSTWPGALRGDDAAAALMVLACETPPGWSWVVELEAVFADYDQVLSFVLDIHDLIARKGGRMFLTGLRQDPVSPALRARLEAYLKGRPGESNHG